MVTMARQKRRARGTPHGISEPRYSIWVLVIVVVVFLVLVGFFVTSAKLFSTTRNMSSHGPSDTSAMGRHFSSPADIPLEVLSQLDAILVLGGGAPESLTEPPVYVQRRADDAAAVVVVVVGWLAKKMPSQQQEQEKQCWR